MAESFPLQGGVDTYTEPALLDHQFSKLQNWRQKGPRGLEQRKGQISLHTVADGTEEITSLFQFVKGERDERHTFRQMSDGSLQKATNNPPTVTTGPFGSEVLAADGGAITAFADAGGGKVTVTSAAHGKLDGNEITINETISYNGRFLISGVTANTFDIVATWVADDATGTWTATVVGTYGVVGDMMLYADGARPHQIYAGEAQRVLAYVVYKGSATIPAIPLLGNDYTIKVSDGRSTTVAVLDSLSTLAAGHALYIITPVRTNKITVTVSKANGTTSVLQGQYWKGSWATTSGFNDGTASGGASHGQTGPGDLTWTLPTDELPHYHFGQSGFVYRFSLASGSFDAEVEVSAVAYEGPIQDMVNVWDGVLTLIPQVQVYDDSQNEAGNEAYKRYSGDFVTLSSFTSADKLYVGSLNRLAGIHVDAGGAPNKVKVAMTGDSDISFFDGGAADDFIKSSDAAFFTEGFEAGMTFAVDDTASNDGTYKILSMSAQIIYVKTGSLTAEPDTSATLTYDNSPAVFNSAKVWTGESFSALSDLEDATEGVTKPGFVTWDRTSQIPQLTQFQDSQQRMYWYELTCTFGNYNNFTDNVTALIQGIPYFEISDWGLGRSVSIWKSRALLTFTQFPNDLYVSTLHRPQMLNGPDFDILTPADGRFNPTVKTEQFHNELLTWQDERGAKGGSVTLWQGFNPTNFGKLMISNDIGLLNANCTAVADGAVAVTATRERVKTLAFWLSRNGVYRTDGGKPRRIDADIYNYFDPDNANSIRRGYEHKHFLHYVARYDLLIIGLVTGDTAVVPNTLLTYHVGKRQWGTEVRGQALSCLADVQAVSGNVPVLTVGGGASDGLTYLLDSTDDDVSTAVDAEFVLEVDGKGARIQLEHVVLRSKALAEAELIVSVARKGNSEFAALTASPLNISPKDEDRNDAHVRYDRSGDKIVSDHLSIKVRNNQLGKRPHILDLGLDISENATRAD